MSRILQIFRIIYEHMFPFNFIKCNISGIAEFTFTDNIILQGVKDIRGPQIHQNDDQRTNGPVNAHLISWPK